MPPPGANTVGAHQHEGKRLAAACGDNRWGKVRRSGGASGRKGVEGRDVNRDGRGKGYVHKRLRRHG